MEIVLRVPNTSREVGKVITKDIQNKGTMMMSVGEGEGSLESENKFLYNEGTVTSVTCELKIMPASVGQER